MTYTTLADMGADFRLSRRCVAAAADEGEADPVGWQQQHLWQLVTAPGWVEAWDSALAAGNPDPGAADDVITDPMILTQVQALRGAI